MSLIATLLLAAGCVIAEQPFEAKDFSAPMRLVLSRPMTVAGEPRGVLCVSLWRHRDDEALRDPAVGGWQPLWNFAESNRLLVVAWQIPRASALWDAGKNDDEMKPKDRSDRDAKLNRYANELETALRDLFKLSGYERQFGKGFLAFGTSGGAQMAIRFAMQKPKLFSAVYATIPSSFDRDAFSDSHQQAKDRILFCVTTGENEPGYERSVKFCDAALKTKFHLIYKTYKGLGHDTTADGMALGIGCLQLALDRREQDGHVNWQKVFGEIAAWGDWLNHRTLTKADREKYDREDQAALVPLPTPEIVRLWSKE